MASELPHYNVIDVRSEFFPAQRYEEFKQLYANGFGVMQKLSLDLASRSLRERHSRPGVMIAAFDRYAISSQDRGEIVGAFVADVSPGHAGMKMTKPEVMVSSEHARQGLGRELSWLGRRHANETSQYFFHRPIMIDESQTDKKRKFLRNWWTRNGYRLVKLYIQAADELFNKLAAQFDQPKDVSFNAAEEHELPQIAKLMSTQGILTSDGGRWTKNRALAFLKFMHEHNIATTQVAKRGTEIISFMTTDVVLKRTGNPSMVDTHYFTKPTSELRSGLTAERVAAALFYSVLHAANTISLDKFRLPVRQIEVFDENAEFFTAMKIMSNLREDKTCAAMRGYHQTLLNNFCPPTRKTGFATNLLLSL